MQPGYVLGPSEPPTVIRLGYLSCVSVRKADICGRVREQFDIRIDIDLLDLERTILKLSLPAEISFSLKI